MTARTYQSHDGRQREADRSVVNVDRVTHVDGVRCALSMRRMFDASAADFSHSISAAGGGAARGHSLRITVIVLFLVSTATSDLSINDHAAAAAAAAAEVSVQPNVLARRL